MRPSWPSQFETSSPSAAYLKRPCTMIEPICFACGKLIVVVQRIEVARAGRVLHELRRRPAACRAPAARRLRRSLSQVIAMIVSLLVEDRLAALARDELAGSLVGVGRLAGREQHLAERLALADVEAGDRAHDDQRVAGADLVEVLGLGAAVEQALEAVASPTAGPRSAPLKVSFERPGNEHRRAEVGRRRRQAAVAGLARAASTSK